FNPCPEAITESVESGERPAGLRRLAEVLFLGEPQAPARGFLGSNPVAGAPGSPDPSPATSPPGPEGLHLIEAPGELGEARLVARQVRTLLTDGTPPDRIIVTARHLPPHAVELLREVFDEYAVPHEAEGGDPLARVPAVAFLLRAWRLPEDDWPFAPLAAVLRSTYFRPGWPQVQAAPEVPAEAEALLRAHGD